VLEPQVFEYLTSDEDSFEDKPLMELATRRQLNAYRHHGFWQAMDTLRDKKQLESMWKQPNPPWKLW
jgi:glucose-1-phosphate cytidylyltransferase